MKRRAQIAAAVLGALALIVAAAFVSHVWDEDAGLDPIYLILALGVIALSLPPTRAWLREATNLKLPGGLEITRQVEDAVEAAAALPDVDEEGSESDADKDPKILDPDWRGKPEVGLGELQAKLGKRLAWIGREVYEGKQETGETAAVQRLRDDGLVRPDQARLLETVIEITGKTVERSFQAGGKEKEAMVRFMLQADRVVYSLRLIVLDRALRNQLGAEGFALMDIGGQPTSRWPDFYAFVPGKPETRPLRVVVRMALNKNSDLIARIRKRLREKLPETPLDPQAQPVIVIPRTSKVKPTSDPEIPVVRRDELPAWIAGQFGDDAPTDG